KRRDPFDARHVEVASEVRGQRDDSIYVIPGKSQEGRMRQRALSAIVSLVGEPHRIDYLELNTRKQGEHFRPGQNCHRPVTHTCTSSCSSHKCDTRPKCSVTHSSQ